MKNQTQWEIMANLRQTKVQLVENIIMQPSGKTAFTSGVPRRGGGLGPWGGIGRDMRRVGKFRRDSGKVRRGWSRWSQVIPRSSTSGGTGGGRTGGVARGGWSPGLASEGPGSGSTSRSSWSSGVGRCRVSGRGTVDVTFKQSVSLTR